VYAIIESGNKQFKVQEGDVINVELLKVDAGDNVVIDKVILVGKDGAVSVGAPYLSGATVDTSVVEHGRGKKVIVYRYKRKTGYHKKNGHRQPFTKLKIEKINA